MLKSILLRVPAAYEAVQSVRDRAFLRSAAQSGSFSQHGEDRELLRILIAAGVRGPFVDVGCNHPFKLSNTFLLYRHGWRGVCVDPLPRFAALYRRWRPEDQCFTVAIDEAPGDLPLFEFESDVLTTLDPSLAAQYSRQGYALLRTSSVTVLPLNQLLGKCKLRPPLSLLSIDIEGFELKALKSIDLEHWQPGFVCIEALTADGGRNGEALDYLSAHGYAVESDLGLNVVFRRQDRNLQ